MRRRLTKQNCKNNSCVRPLTSCNVRAINTILFQTRLRSTTAYPSRYEPWDGAFSGTPGVAPPYDVLAFAVEEAHRRGMELHAYLVAYPICSVALAKQLGKQSLPARRPDLCVRAATNG